MRMGTIVVGSALLALLHAPAEARWTYQGTHDALSRCLTAATEAANEITALGSSVDTFMGICMGGEGYIVPDNVRALDQYEYAHTRRDGMACVSETLKIHPQASPTVDPYTFRQTGGEIDPDYWKWLSICLQGKGYLWVPPAESE